jgi:hypothetical protein
MDVPFSAFSAFQVDDLDFVSFDFMAPAGTTLLLDDFSMLGRWRTD